MNNFVTNDISKSLKDIYHEDKDARAIFDWFATRQNDAREVAADRAAVMAEVGYPDVIRVFRILADIGCGRFLIGRKSHKTRMAWDYSIRSLAAAAQGGAQAIEEIDPEFVEDSIEADEEEETHGLLTHEFQLRARDKVQIKLPSDLSAKEAERLAAFIKTLPFE
ncbi:MAG: hypothetical protein ACREC9_16025 [Methylocella sp.]